LVDGGTWSLRRRALATGQLGDGEAGGCQTLAQVIELGANQLRGSVALGPYLAGQRALQQLGLHLQRAERCHVEGQLDPP